MAMLHCEKSCNILIKKIKQNYYIPYFRLANLSDSVDFYRLQKQTLNWKSNSENSQFDNEEDASAIL